MSRVRGKDPKPEMPVRQLVHGLGFRYRLHRRDLPGTPDLVLPRWCRDRLAGTGKPASAFLILGQLPGHPADPGPRPDNPQCCDRQLASQVLGSHAGHIQVRFPRDFAPPEASAANRTVTQLSFLDVRKFGFHHVGQASPRWRKHIKTGSWMTGCRQAAGRT